MLPPNTQPPPGTSVETPLEPTKVRYRAQGWGFWRIFRWVVLALVIYGLGKCSGAVVLLTRSSEHYNKPIVPAVEDPRLGYLGKSKLGDGKIVDLRLAARGEMPAGKGARPELTPGQEPARTDLANAVDELLAARGELSDIRVDVVPEAQAPQRASAEVAPVRHFGLAL